MRQKRRLDWFLAGLMALAAFFLFYDLGGRSLWEDEAETALLAQSVLRTGLPIAFDGINVVSTEGERAFDGRFLWRWSPWSQFYAAAASMRVMGVTSAGARAIFALMGLLCVPALYWLALELFQSQAIARLSAFYLVFAVPFILHSRQARWYSAAFLLVIPTTAFFIILGRGRRFLAGFIISAILLFYTNYLVAIALVAALCGALPLLGTERPRWKTLAAAVGVVGVAAVPGWVFFQVLGKSEPFSLARFCGAIWFYVGCFLTFMVPATLLALLAGARSDATARRRAMFLLAVCGLYGAALSLAPVRMFRYLYALVPLACVLNAVGTQWLMSRNRAMGLALAGVLAFTSLLHRAPLGWFGASGARTADFFPSLGPVSFPAAGLLYELTHRFSGADGRIAEYLREHAAPGDVVLATGEDLPLQFYTGLKVVGGFQGRALAADPDWIVIHPWILSREPGKDYDVARFIDSRIDLSAYQEVSIGPDYLLENNADPAYHLFKEPPSGRRLLFLRRAIRKPLQAAPVRPG